MVLRKYKLSTLGETKRLIGEDDNYPEPMLFREKLYVFDKKGKRIGRFSLNVDQEDSGEDSPKILYVHISNRAFIDGRLSESVVTGTITHQLKTLEEIRYESTEVAGSAKHERCLFLLREKTKYYLSVTTEIGDLKNQTQMTIPFGEAIGLIGESSNAVLMRKLARAGHEGILCLNTILSNGKRCKNYYVTKLSKQMVNGTKMEVLIIYRIITNHKRCNLTMTMALTRAGQLIYLFWSNSKYFLHIDPDVDVNTHRFTYGETQLHMHWPKDIQLYSIYLDRVDQQTVLNRSFKYQREELRRILGDFVAYVLLMKPKDIICFAIEYFTAFSRSSIRKCSSKSKYSEEYFGELNDSWGNEDDDYQFWLGEGGYFSER